MSLPLAPAATNQQLEKAFQKIAKVAKEAGIGRYLIGVKHGPIVTIRMEDMLLNEAMQVAITAFHQTIDIHLFSKREKFPKEFADIYVRAKEKFANLVKEVDIEVINYLKANPEFKP